MTTLSDLVEEITGNLQGFTATQDQVTSLAAPAGATDLVLSVADATGVSRGIIEIDQELIWVQSVDQQANTVTVLPKGRGWRGTTAAAHGQDSTVSVSPIVPRSVIVRTITDQINALYPSLFGVSTAEFTFNDPTRVDWALPADCEAILDVRYRDYIGQWQRVRQWELERGVDATDFPTGVALRATQVPMGCTVQVVYATAPAPLVNLTDDFSLTGLSVGSKDLVVWGSLVRLIPMFDVARLTATSAVASELDQPRPLGSALSVADKLRTQYQQRLQEERRILSDRFPARIHYVR